MPNLNTSILGGVPLAVPGLPTQQAIGAVLGALDDKIAANVALVETADGLVRARFVEMARATNVSTTIGELATYRRETVDPTACPPNTPYIGLEHIPRRKLWMAGGGKADGVTSGKSRFSRGDILFGKLRPYFHKVVESPVDGVCSTDVLVLSPRDPSTQGFVLASVASDEVVAASTASSKGTRMPRTSWQDLASVATPWPGLDAARSFAATVDVISARVHGALSENDWLSATRDALLPALLSGEISVKEAELAAGEVA
jgi:type I restriction enzyme S subunit